MYLPSPRSEGREERLDSNTGSMPTGAS